MNKVSKPHNPIEVKQITQKDLDNRWLNGYNHGVKDCIAEYENGDRKVNNK